jgi:hypothetical protein
MLSRSPATDALNAALTAMNEGRQLGKASAKPMIIFNGKSGNNSSSSSGSSNNISSNALKRCRDTFNMSNLMQASIPVEESIKFPAIEWDLNLFAEDAEDEQDDELPRPSKRRCNGLSRTKRVHSDLSLQEQSCGQLSSGSLC